MTKEEKKIANKQYYLDNKAKVCAKVNEYRKANVEKIAQYKIDNKDVISKSKSDYREENKEKIAKYNNSYNTKNKVVLAKKHKIYKELNTEKIKEYKRKYRKENKSIYDKWRSLLHSTLKRLNKLKEGKTIDLLGYSALELHNHMIILFSEGMSWENHGEWHIDHIKPLSKFDEGTHPSIVNALSNLQPLWATTREINGVLYLGNLNKSDIY